MAGPEPQREAQNEGPVTIKTTRLAPSPTGALHLGNARTFLVNWLLARQQGWRIILRMEDLDGPRIKSDADRSAIETLAWLGLDWDEGPIYQSHDLEPYRQALDTLARAGRAYPCAMTRKQIEQAASAPHEGGELRFGPELRPEIEPRTFVESDVGWRFVTPACSVSFDDEFKGAQTCDPSAEVGDFPIWTKQGQPAYQLAVVVDDHRQGVTHIVRGDDLVDSAGRQRLLYEALGIGPMPRYCHLPLVLGPDGRRLAKRHGDTRLTRYRKMGVSANRVLSLLGRWCSIEMAGTDEIKVEDLLSRFELARMPREPVTFTKEDEAWLLDGTS